MIPLNVLKMRAALRALQERGSGKCGMASSCGCGYSGADLRSMSEPPWVRWRLQTYESRMEGGSRGDCNAVRLRVRSPLVRA